MSAYGRLLAGGSVTQVKPHLPQEEVTEAHLSGGADEQVRIGRVAAVQALAEQGLRDVTANTTNETTALKSLPRSPVKKVLPPPPPPQGYLALMRPCSTPHAISLTALVISYLEV